jgi:hypothetical protein
LSCRSSFSWFTVANVGVPMILVGFLGNLSMIASILGTFDGAMFILKAMDGTSQQSKKVLSYL